VRIVIDEESDTPEEAAEAACRHLESLLLNRRTRGGISVEVERGPWRGAIGTEYIVTDSAEEVTK
jgi:hypothetical protein